MRLAEHVDKAVYDGIVRGGHRFRDVGVEQLGVDHARLCQVFRLFSSTHPSGSGGSGGSGGGRTLSVPLSPFPLLSESLRILNWNSSERESLIEALEQLSSSDEVEQYVHSKYDDNEATVEQRQMHDMLRTKGIHVMHPEHVLFVSSLRLQ